VAAKSLNKSLTKLLILGNSSRRND
jgi:hypothetical protein